MRLVPDEEVGPDAQLVAQVRVYLQPDGRLLGGWDWHPERLPQVAVMHGRTVPRLTELYVLPDTLWRLCGTLVLAVGEAIAAARAEGSTIGPV
jgi:hypothetical protein